MRNFLKKNRVLLIILLIIAVLAVVFFVRRGQTTNTTSQLQTATIERGKLTATIGATGTVRAKQTALLIWQAAGTVDTVNVKVGDNVPEGFVMAFLSKTSLPQSIIMADSDLVSAQTDLENLQTSDTALAQAVIDLRTAKDAYDKANNWRKELNGRIRVKKIIYKQRYGITVPILKEYMQNADTLTIAKADEDLALKKAKLDDAQRTYDRLSSGNKTDIAAAQARVDAAKATVNLARIIAPFNGIVTEASSLPGDQVSAGASAFRIDDLSSLLVDVAVSEVDINNVTIGQPVTLTFDAILGKTYHGKVTEVGQAGTVSQGVVTFNVTVELSDADANVRPGMTAAANITIRELDNVLLVPNRAVRLNNGNRMVYVMTNGIPSWKNITLGDSSDTMSVVVDGLAEGDVIILNPPANFSGPGGGARFGGGG